MCSKLEGIFKHICLTTWTHAYICMEWHGILIQKNRKMIRNTWKLGWCNVMPPRWCGNLLACLMKVWTHTPHKLEQLTRRLVVSRGNNACLLTNRRWLSLTAFNFFLHVTCTNTTVMWKIGKFQGSFDLSKTFKWFSNHLMTVIQIWTTSTWNA